MDETQKRKLSAKEFLEKNRRIGYIVAIIFVSLFIIYFAAVYFYSKELSAASPDSATSTNIASTFLGSLLPVFNETVSSSSEIDTEFLGKFGGNTQNGINNSDGTEATDNSKLVQIEGKPILGYVVFDKPVSIINYIQNKPKICAEKLAVVTTKEEKSPAVLSFQNMLKSTDDYADTPTTGILDEATREKLYIFQTRYADILYKNKADKSPTRVIDKETVHFLNLLCNFEKENKDDFVQVPNLRYVLKETRQIFDYNTATFEKTEVQAKIATGTQEIAFSHDGNYIVFRKDILGTIDSQFYNVKFKSLTHLENNITTLDFTPDGKLIYGTPGFSGMTVKSYDPGSNSIKRILTLPLNEWNVYAISKTSIGINSKPSALADGIYMMLDVTTKKLRQLAGPFPGLSLQKTDTPDFTILSTGGAGVTKTLLLNNVTRNIGDFGINTFAEKCSETIFANGIFCGVPKNLSQNFIYPDDWYKGKMDTQDVLMFKTLNGTSSKIISYLENRTISVINLNVNKNEIFFMDNNTFALYSLQL